MALYFHHTASVIELMLEHVEKTRDPLDQQILEDVLLGKGPMYRLADKYNVKLQEVRERRERLMIELRQFLVTVGINKLHDIAL